jgi:hypothetical protein
VLVTVEGVIILQCQSRDRIRRHDFSLAGRILREA